MPMPLPAATDGWWMTPNFDPDRVAESLRYAMKGIGCDDKTLIPLVTYTPRELDAVKQAFARKFGKDLLQCLKSETYFHFEKVLLMIFRDPVEMHADSIHDAWSMTKDKEETVLEILIARNNEEKARLQMVYSQKYGRSIDQATGAHTHGSLKHLIQRLLEPRNPDGPVDDAQARSDANILYRAGEGKIGTDETTFINIFARSSFTHLRAICNHYPNCNKKHHTLQQAVEDEFSFSLKFGLGGILTIALYGPFEFQAYLAHRAMKGIGTQDTRLIRVIVGNRQYMPQIKACYLARFQKQLSDAVHHETSGSYRSALETIINFQPPRY